VDEATTRCGEILVMGRLQFVQQTKEPGCRVPCIACEIEGVDFAVQVRREFRLLQEHCVIVFSYQPIRCHATPGAARRPIQHDWTLPGKVFVCVCVIVFLFHSSGAKSAKLDMLFSVFARARALNQHRGIWSRRVHIWRRDEIFGPCNVHDFETCSSRYIYKCC